MGDVASHCGLIRNFLMTNAIEHVFMGLLAIRVSSLEKCLFKIFAHFKIELFVFLLLSCKSALYILDISPLSGISFAYIFLPFSGLPFHTPDGVL